MIVVTVGMLFFLPITSGIYAIRTDTKEDRIPATTAAGVTTANLTLTYELYDDDTSSISLLSSDSDDIPALVAYTTATHTIEISGLAASTTRTISVTYDKSALTLWSGFDTLLNYMPMVWYIIIVAFVPLSLLVIWKYRSAD